MDVTTMPTTDLVAALRVAIAETYPTRSVERIEALRGEFDARVQRHPNRCVAHMDDAADTCPCYAAAFAQDAAVATGTYRYTPPAEAEQLVDDGIAADPDEDPWGHEDEDGWDVDAAYERWLETRYDPDGTL